MYIVKDSNERYFVKWIESSPIFNGDVSSAKVLSEIDADKVIKTLKMINKGRYEKVLCDDHLAKLIKGKCPEWYRRQITGLLNKYREMYENIEKDETHSLNQQIVNDLESILNNS
ncbi:hypothetical protein AALB39_04160 [Lachnospiraceae bacterium 54-53]